MLNKRKGLGKLLNSIRSQKENFKEELKDKAEKNRELEVKIYENQEKFLIIKDRNDKLKNRQMEIKDSNDALINDINDLSEMAFEILNTYKEVLEVIEDSEKKELLKIKMERLMNRYSVTNIAEKGMEYNPEYHEVMEDMGLYAGLKRKFEISAIIEQGYKLKERVLKIAKVEVKEIKEWQ